MSRTIVYTTAYCQFCTRAKQLLKARGIPYEEIDISEDAEARSQLVQRTGRRTVPQIFIDERAIGGYEELAALDAAGELKGLVSGDA